MYIFFIQPLHEKIKCPLCYPASIDMISNWQPNPAFPNPFHIGSFASSVQADLLCNLLRLMQLLDPDVDTFALHI